MRNNTVALEQTEMMVNKKYFNFLLFAVVGLLNSCSSSNDWDRFGLSGKVKTYSERSYDVEMKFGEWSMRDLEIFGHNKVSFDKEGNYQWIESLDRDDKLTGKLISRRENGEVIEENYYDGDGELIRRTKYIQNSRKSLEYISYDEDGKKVSQGVSYFVNDRIVKQEYQTFADGDVKEKYTVLFEYDKKGNLINQKMTNEKGKIIIHSKHEYLTFDENGNWTERLDYSSENDDEPDKIVIREYEYY